MTPGELARRLLGPFTDPVVRRYRRLFVDLEHWGSSLASYPDTDTVLEIGCGDGHLCQVLATRLPVATILGIDIADEPGRLYSGRSMGVEFRKTGAEELVRSGTTFDLVVLCDVLHHVPLAERAGLVRSAWQLVGPGGRLAVKDWIRTNNLSTLAAYLSDRFVTGDRVVFFDSAHSFADLLGRNCMGGRTVAEGTVPPRDNNQFQVVMRPEET